eukprot:6196138-Pleurochrysis_carterae.AAC.5
MVPGVSRRHLRAPSGSSVISHLRSRAPRAGWRGGRREAGTLHSTPRATPPRVASRPLRNELDRRPARLFVALH